MKGIGLRQVGTVVREKIESETPPSPPPHNTKLLVGIAVFFIVVAVGLASAYFVSMKNEKKVVKSISCTQEAKACPDGSTVTRTGPNCEFTQCPIAPVIEVEETEEEILPPLTLDEPEPVIEPPQAPVTPQETEKLIKSLPIGIYDPNSWNLVRVVWGDFDGDKIVEVVLLFKSIQPTGYSIPNSPLYDVNLLVIKDGKVAYDHSTYVTQTPGDSPDQQKFYSDATLELKDVVGDAFPEAIFHSGYSDTVGFQQIEHIVFYNKERRAFFDISR